MSLVSSKAWSLGFNQRTKGGKTDATPAAHIAERSRSPARYRVSAAAMKTRAYDSKADWMLAGIFIVVPSRV